MRAFIAYLTGRMDWIDSIYGMNEIASPSPLLQRVRDLLEMNSAMDAISLYRLVNATPSFDDKLQALLGLSYTDGALQDLVPTNAQLVGTAVSNPVVEASQVASSYTLTISYRTSTEAELISSGYRVAVPCVYNPATSTLNIEWPRSLNIVGNVLLPTDITWSRGTQVTIPTRQAYPVREVVARLDASDDAYALLIETDMTGTYYAFSRPIDRLCVMVLAIIKQAKHESS